MGQGVVECCSSSFVVSLIQIDRIKSKIFALGSVLQKMIQPNATKSVFFSEKFLAQKRLCSSMWDQPNLFSLAKSISLVKSIL